MRALRTLVTSQLHALIPSFEAAIADQFEREIMQHMEVNGKKNFTLYPTVALPFRLNYCQGITSVRFL